MNTARAGFITSICIVWIAPRKWRRSGLDEIFDRDAVVLIEWGERFPELMPERPNRNPARTAMRSRMSFPSRNYNN